MSGALRLSGDVADPGPRIVFLDRDEVLRGDMAGFFRDQGFDARAVGDGAELDKLLEAPAPTLIVLDQFLIGEGGLSICRRLSHLDQTLGVLFLSSQGDETDRIIALELGADDYILKPCSPRELLARVRAVLRRRPLAAQPPAPAPARTWVLNGVCNSIRTPRGVDVRLSGAELALLGVMAEQPMTLLSREDLLDLTRGPNSGLDPRGVDIMVSRLRRKVRRVEPQEELIRTVRGGGYVLTGEIVPAVRQVVPAAPRIAPRRAGLVAFA